MKSILGTLLLCLVPYLNLAQSSAGSAARTLKEQSAKVQAFYDEHAYGEAAALLEKLATDPQITALPGWLDQLYNLACDQTLEGNPQQAILTLQRAVDQGASATDGRVFEGTGIPPQIEVSPSVSDIRNGTDAALERAIKLLGHQDSAN